MNLGYLHDSCLVCIKLHNSEWRQVLARFLFYSLFHDIITSLTSILRSIAGSIPWSITGWHHRMTSQDDVAGWHHRMTSQEASRMTLQDDVAGSITGSHHRMTSQDDAGGWHYRMMSQAASQDDVPTPVQSRQASTNVDSLMARSPQCTSPTPPLRL